MADASAGSENHQALTRSELQLLLQPDERRDAVGAEGACLVGRQVGRYDRGLAFLDGHVLGIETALVPLRKGLLLAQRDHRIDARRAQRRQQRRG